MQLLPVLVWDSNTRPFAPPPSGLNHSEHACKQTHKSACVKKQTCLPENNPGQLHTHSVLRVRARY